MQPRPIRRLLFRELLVLGGIVIPLVTALSWIGLIHVLRGRAEERAHDSLRSLAVQISDRLLRIADAAASLAHLWREGLLDPARPEEARLYLFPLLGQLPGTGTIMLVRADDGFSFFVVRTGDTYRNETVRPVDREHSDVTITVEDLQARIEPPFTRRLPYHPLSRPWIDEAIRLGRPFWSAPYEFKVFLDTPRERHVGITHGVPVLRTDGSTLGYVGIDVVLADFSALCAAVRPTPGSVVAVLDDEGRILGSSVPADSAPLLAQPGPDRLPVFAELLRSRPDPAAAQIVKAQRRS